MKLEDAAKILNLSGDVTPETIKAAYRRASSKYHPDKGGSVEMMQTVNQAY
jgi:DnaJ-class molecular chaperone